MRFATTVSRYLPRIGIRSAYLPAAVALVVVLIAGIFADQQYRNAHQQRLRAEVIAQASLVRARLEGLINGNIQLVRGLATTLSTEPGMDQSRFTQLASHLFDESGQIRHVAAAPGLVVSLIHPMEGNERAIGLNYNEHPVQRASALRARETGELVLVGPVDLVQGGRGFIGRFPVFSASVGGEREFWGILSAVIDLERLYRDSGLLDENLPIAISIRGQDALGEAGIHFYGAPQIFEDDPVLSEVLLPSGSWQLAAIPHAGWDVDPPSAWIVRILMAGAGALILLPIIFSGRLMEERQRYIGALQNRERELGRLSRRLRLALDTSQVGVWELKIGEEMEIWDARMNELYGYPGDGGPRSSEDWERRVHPDDRDKAWTEFNKAIETRSSYVSAFRIVREDGSERHIRALGRVFTEPGGAPRVVGVNWDVTEDVLLNEELRRANALSEARNAELEATKSRIEHNALHDSLTGLPNRRYLDQILAEHAQCFDAGSERAALLHIDLDRFKQINDTLGHPAGDAMLVHTAATLREAVGGKDFVARVGGDEFVIVIRREHRTGEPSSQELAELAGSIIDRMGQPVLHEGHECRLGVSIGIASDLDSLADPRRLLVNADIALYRAKRRGRNRYQFFNDSLQAEIVTTKRVADDILSGLERGEFIAHYQPQFDASTLEIVGVEALARWRHPVEGLLAPAAFMKIAEELNVVATIDRMILEQALRDFGIWQRKGVGIPKVSVNVSARRLHDEELMTTLSRLDMAEGTVSFELVESIFLDDHDETIAWNVDRIKDLGIDIEIDDFGTGHASIVSLMKLQPRRLKIDRQLVMPITRSEQQRHLVGSIIDIGHSLGIEVLAEGVETMEHARVLKSLGCNALQGYAFARAMSGPELARFVAGRSWRRAS